MMYTFIRAIFILHVLFLHSCKQNENLVEVTVTEGTNMAAVLSPDHKTLVIALQGTLLTIPASGGDAIATTDEFGDCHEPAWAPDGSSQRSLA